MIQLVSIECSLIAFYYTFFFPELERYKARIVLFVSMKQTIWFERYFHIVADSELFILTHWMLHEENWQSLLSSFR